jgi:hypothetical protein
MNRRAIIKLLAQILLGMLVLVAAAAFFSAAMVALSPAQYEYECQAVTLQDEFGNAHEIHPKDRT